MSNPKIKVLVVDDSAVVRQALSAGLDKYPDIEVVGCASDPFVAREMILSLNPDVLTLDIEMPRMDGLTFLQKLMAARPIPTIVVSSVAPSGSRVAMACLEAGAFDVVAKPSAACSLGETVDQICQLIRAASGTKPVAKPPTSNAPPPLANFNTTHKIILIGASTGGTEATRAVLRRFPVATPGIVIVQHMPPGFTRLYAESLGNSCTMRVKEAADGDAVIPGLVLLAPGNQQLRLTRDGARYVVRVFDGPRVSSHRPSVDVMFGSAAKAAGPNAVATLLTGMGSDGAQGLLELRKSGAHTIAQSERTCVVYGMPAEAVKIGAACEVADLDEIPSLIARAIAAKHSEASASARAA
ncbi:MAG: chemotaxis response regulator protein-glutamate methylesterase [Planctomycetota bacterium]|nr:chemotaxis response regulator protein-glutamate methylesterase [Planctomycetota bacterium]